MRYIHLPPASKIAWDQAPQWRRKGKNHGETAKTKTGERSKPSGGLGRGKDIKAQGKVKFSPALTPPQTTARLALLP